jgi:glutamine synthetase
VTDADLDADIRAVDLLLPDLNGILRCKRIRRAHFGTIAAEGMRIPGSTFSMDSTGLLVDGTGIVAEEGERDRYCKIVPGTLSRVPWSADDPHGPRAQALVFMEDEDGSPFFADPRTALGRAVESLANDGLSATVAVELEFHLHHGEDPRTASPLPSALGRATQSYAVARMDERSAFIEDVHAACEALGVSTGTTVAESGEGHYEINLQHRDDPLGAVADALVFEHAVRNVAAAHGSRATFMAKPWTDQPGSGMHVHASLSRADGTPLFVSDPEVNEALRHAVGGLCATMAEATALLAPNANSYRRFVPGTFVANTASWGRNNRTAAVRIPPGAARIEHRVAGADANPYLVVAAVLAGMHHGIAQKVTPPNEIRDDVNTHALKSLPGTWERALAVADDAKILPALLGERFWDLFLRVKKTERARFERQVSPLERELYLEVV